MDAITNGDIRLTEFAHGGGCGCKIAPGVLSDILKNSGSFPLPADLLIGRETADDAAVYRLNSEQAIVATTDFFMPIVDDPYDFGRIAATNAISDIYAMGATPIMALAIVGMPINKLPMTVIQLILEGGESKCAEAGIPVAGGHSIDSVEPIYGLVVLGIAHPDRIKANNSARPGDVLVLGKALGIGIMSAALKKGALDDEGYRQMIASTTQLNKPGHILSRMEAVNALTDITGFGLLGHLLEISRGSGLGATLDMPSIPLLPGVEALAKSGYVTGASGRNWTSYGAEVDLAPTITTDQKALLCDPQTSGGLLVACRPEAAGEVIALFKREGFRFAAQIGTFDRATPGVSVA